MRQDGVGEASGGGMARVRGESEEEALSAGTSGYVKNWAGVVLQTNPSYIFSWTEGVCNFNFGRLKLREILI
jgi:hypothetical protein